MYVTNNILCEGPQYHDIGRTVWHIYHQVVKGLMRARGCIIKSVLLPYGFPSRVFFQSLSLSLVVFFVDALCLVEHRFF